MGKLAPLHYEWASEWSPVGRAPIAEPVLGIASYQDTVFVLQEHGWSSIAGVTVNGPFGGSEFPVGKRNQAPSAIAVAKGRVYVLDGERHTISAWSSRGQFIERLGSSTALAAIRGVNAMRADDSSRIFIVARPSPTPARLSWRLLRLSPHGDTPSVLYPAPATRKTLGLMDMFAFDVDPNGAVVIASANDFRFHWLDATGNILRETTRAAAPFWRFSVTERERYSSVLKKVPPGMQSEYQLSEFAPAVRDVARLANGRTIVMTATPNNGVLVELCDSEGRALGRLNEETLPESSTFITRRGIFRITANPSGFPLIELRTLRIPPSIGEEN
jgi:hypothetical protein